MLKIDKTRQGFNRLEPSKLSSGGYTERYGLQAMIKRDPDAFFTELGETLLLLGEEVRPSTTVDDRIDLLAIDESGSTVVIELKRGSHKLQLLQAIAYAGMIRGWGREALINLRAKMLEKPTEEAEDDIRQFILEDVGALNESQRIILIAEDFEYEVLIGAQWLGDAHDVDVRCYKLSMSVDGDNDYLSCVRVYPPPDVSEHALSRGRRVQPGADVGWSSWEEALADVQNRAVVDFFKREISGGRVGNIARRTLRYRLGTRRYLAVAARQSGAYVWQTGRFEGDVKYWRELLGEAADVEPVKQGTCLSFFLSEPEQFSAFGRAVREDLPGKQFS